MISHITPLSDHLLIAMPQLDDPNFAHSLTYLCSHDHHGAMGIMINKPLNLSMGDIFEHIGIHDPKGDSHRYPVYAGGPIQPERGFVLHPSDTKWEATTPVSDHTSLTTSRDILEAIAHDQGPLQFCFALGYAGWDSGQLEGEIAQNAWLTSDAPHHILFNTPTEQKWHSAASLLGVDLNLMSSAVGHA